MKNSRTLPGLALLLGASLLMAPTVSAQEALHARVSFDAGSTMVQGREDADWANAPTNTLVFGGDTLWVDQRGTAEVEFAGGSYLRMADGSKAEITALPPSATVRVWVGSVYVHRLNRATGEFVVTTPAGTVQVDKNTNSRVDVAANGATVVSVRWGRATVRANGDQPVTVVDAQRVYVDPGMLPSLPVAFDRAVEDAFDTWNRERCEILVNGISRVPSTVTVTPTTLGAAELASSGEWVYVENRHYWRPTVVVDYVPYRYGHWSYVPTYGHVWVGHYGFSYITSHYGRWNYFPTYGWCWSYDPIWAPAWVATARYGPYFVWTPIDFYNRPVFWGNASYFSLGGLRWNFYACSFAPVDYVYWGPSYIRPLYGSNIPTIYANNVTIWNIYGGSRYPDRHRIPYQDNRLTVRDYNPPRSIRGPEVYGPSGRAATDRVRVLEASAGRERFSTVDPAAPRSVRTASATGGRSANVRTINQIERPSRDAFLRGDVGRDGAPAAVRNARSDVDNEAARGRTRTDRSGAPGAPSASPPERTAPSVTRPDAVSPRTPGER
ncbi:MAG TPA: FecR domain-containing protein, partial [Candidatus Hydrogenedentes bacterium]|nr:FecR domain-containing protein [Candidatus Hydrogenedentota bacterium]